MLYLIVEHFRNGNPGPVYERFRTEGRLAPAGLSYIDSWVTADLQRCYQIMECDNPSVLQKWIAAWDELIEFEVHPVISSFEAASLVHGQSECGTDQHGLTSE